MVALKVDQGRPAAALDLGGQAFALYRGLGAALEDPIEVRELGHPVQRADYDETAVAVFRFSLVQSTAGTGHVLRGTLWRGLSQSHEALGQMDAAIACQHEALALGSQFGLDGTEGLLMLATLHLRRGGHWQAQVLLREALASAEAHGNAPGVQAARLELLASSGNPVRPRHRLLGQGSTFPAC